MKRALWLLLSAMATAALASAPIVLDIPPDLAAYALANEAMFATDDVDGLQEAPPREGPDADFDVFLEQLGTASRLWTTGNKERAYLQMEDALRDYAGRLQTQFPAQPLSAIEQDVFEIREVVRARQLPCALPCRHS